MPPRLRPPLTARPARVRATLALLLLACTEPPAAPRAGGARAAAEDAAPPRAAAVGATAPAGANPVRTENAKPGTTAWRITNPATNHEIEGYASRTSVNRGAQLDLYVSTTAPTFDVVVYRVGWYGGLGARQVWAAAGLPGVRQPAPRVDPVTRMADAAHWTRSLTVAVPASADPADWASGVYLAKLTAAGGKESYVIFVVRDDARASDFVFQLAVTTYQAYNTWGGHSLYTAAPARKVSFDRPYWYSGDGRLGIGAGDFLTMNADSTYPAPKAGWEVNMVRFLEREGYDVTYVTDVDTHEDAARVAGRRAFLSVGHDEYWSREMRRTVELLRDRGVGLGFFNGNSVYWQVRFEPGPTGAPSRTMVSYKAAATTEDPYAVDGDPANDAEVTVRFRDAPVNNPESSLLGVWSGEDAVAADLVVTNAAQWPFDGTGLANGARLPGLVGYEVDLKGPTTPANAVVLAHSPFTSAWRVTGYADMVTYAAASGATVFAAGTIQWAWGLDDFAAAPRPAVLSPAAQQITRNVLARIARFPGAPLAPSSLRAAQTGGGAVALAWTDNAADEAGFEVERATGTGAFALVGRAPADARGFTDAAVARKTSYRYRVRAVNAAGSSAYSNTASVKTR